MWAAPSPSSSAPSSAPVAGFTQINLREVEDQASKFGLAPGLEGRFSTKDLGLDKAGIEVRENEEFRAKPLILGMVGSRLTFEEDKAFREMFKFLGEKNQDWQNTRIALPWDMAYDLDIPKDAPLGKERMKKLGG